MSMIQKFFILFRVLLAFFKILFWINDLILMRKNYLFWWTFLINFYSDVIKLNFRFLTSITFTYQRARLTKSYIQWVYLCFTSDNDKISVFVYSASMACSSTRLLIVIRLTIGCLGLDLFPLRYELKLAIVCYLLYYLNAIEIIENHVPVTLASKYINLVVNPSTRMTISSLRDYALLNALIPSQFSLIILV